MVATQTINSAGPLYLIPLKNFYSINLKRPAVLLFGGIFIALIFSCSKSPDPIPEPRNNTPALPAIEVQHKKSGVSQLDEEFANYILEGDTKELVRRASTILTTGSSKDTIASAVYWRDIAMLFLGIEQLDWSLDSMNLGGHQDYQRWANLPDKLIYQMLRRIVIELNNCVRGNSEMESMKTQLARLKQENWVLTQKNFKLEKLLQDLEKVK